MRTPDLPPECYPAIVRLPAYNYPLRDDNDLIELVGRFCGEDTRDLIKKRLGMEPMNDDRKRLSELIERISDAAEEISMAIGSIEQASNLVLYEYVREG